MRKSLLYLFAMIGTLSAFTSCGDDEKTPEWQGLSKDYATENLKLTLNGKEMTGQSVNVVATAENKATITLKSIIPGASEINVDATLANVTAANSTPNYAIEGEAKAEDTRTVSVKGNISGDVLTLSTTIKIASPVVGTWKLPRYVLSDINGDGKIDEKDYNIAGGCFFIDLKSATGSVNFMEQTLPDAMFNAAVDQMLEGMISAKLQSITLMDNGSIVASFAKDGQNFTTTAEGMVSYYVKNNMVYVVPDIATMMGMMNKANAGGGMTDILGMLQAGIPVAYKITEAGGKTSASFSMTKEMITPLISILNKLMPLIGNKLPESAVGIINQVVPVVQGSKSISVGLNTEK